MTEKDKRLIAQAERLGSADWETVYDLAEQADTETAREYLNTIGSLLYHRDEYKAGLL